MMIKKSIILIVSWLACMTVINAVTQVNLTTQVKDTLQTNTIKDTNGNPFILSSGTTSAVDSITVTNAATANPATVQIAGTGSDTNITLKLLSKGTGLLNFNGLTISANGTTISGTVTVLQSLGNISIISPNVGVLRAAQSWCVNTGACSPVSPALFDIQGITRLAGHVFTHTTAPAVGGTGCAASGTINDIDGAISLSVGATSCTVTFATAQVAPICVVSPSTTSINPAISSLSTTILTVAVAAISGTVYYHCDSVN